MKLSLAIPDVLMLALALQGFILSGVLWYSSHKIKSNRWLSLFIFCISIETLWPIALGANIFVTYPVANYLFFPANLALGPLIYFYTRSLIFGNDQLPRRKYLYFLPMLIEMKHQIVFLLYASGALSIPLVQRFYFKPQIQALLVGPGNRLIFISVISFTIYLILSYRLAVSNEADKETSAFKFADLRWLKKLLLFLSALLIIWFIGIVLGNTLQVTWNYYLVFLPTMAFVQWLGMKGYLRQASMAPADIEVYNKPAKIYFSDNEIKAYSNQLLQLMTIDRLYLDAALKVEDIAAKLQLPVKHVSSLLNQHIGRNFNDYINSYRVEEAKQKLANPLNNQFTIAALAFDCGFNSLTTFQRSFKQFSGITPSEYQNSLKLTVAANQ